MILLINLAYATGSRQIPAEEAPMFITVVAISLVLIFVLFRVISFLNRSICPTCAARATLKWRYATIFGGPDRRYSGNAQFCSAPGCGWESDAAEKAEQLEQDRERNDTSVQAVIFLFKYIALADGKYTQNERNFAVTFIEDLFPGRWRAGRIGVWMDILKPEGGPIRFNLHAAEPKIRQHIYKGILDLTTSDGSMTAGEKKRLKEVQIALGVNSKGVIT